MECDGASPFSGQHLISREVASGNGDTRISEGKAVAGVKYQPGSDGDSLPESPISSEHEGW